MFNGKTDESIALLQKAGKLIEQIEKAEARNAKLKTLKSKCDKQRKDLERRAGKKIGGQGDAKDDEGAGKPTGPPKSLPRSVREKKRPFDQAVRAVESKIGWVEKAKDGSASKSPLEYAKDAEELLPQLKSAFDALKAEADKAGAGEHPDIIEAQKKATDLPEQVKKLRGTTEKEAADQADAQQGVDADLAKLKAEAERLREKIFNRAGGNPIYYNDLKPVRELLPAIEDFEKNDKDAAQKLVDDFKAKYGATREEIDKRIGEPVYAFDTLSKGIANVAKTRTAMAEDLLKQVARRVDGLEHLHDFYRLDGHGSIRECLDIAAKFDAKPVEAARPEVEKALAADLKKLGLFSRIRG